MGDNITYKPRKVLRVTPLGLRKIIREFFAGAPDSWRSKKSFGGGDYGYGGGYGGGWYDDYDEYDYYDTQVDGDDDDGDDGDDGGDD